MPQLRTMFLSFYTEFVTFSICFYLLVQVLSLRTQATVGISCADLVAVLLKVEAVALPEFGLLGPENILLMRGFYLPR